MSTQNFIRSWKLLDSNHVDRLLRGEIMIRSLDYYADLEERNNDGWIGDRFENGGERFLDQYDSDHDDAGVREKLKPWIASEGGRVVINNLVIKDKLPHCHAFCVTVGDVQEQLAQFDYDTAIEIVDLGGLADAVMAEGTLLHAPDVRATDLFTAKQVGQVTYGEKRASIESGENPESSPFVKPGSYSDQEESRIVFWAADELLHDQIVIKVPRPERFFGQQLSVDKAAKPNAATQLPLEEELAQLLRDLQAFDEEWSAKTFQATRQASAKLRELRATPSSDPMELYRQESELAAPVNRIVSERAARQDQFRPRILDATWRARIEMGIRLRGTAQGMMRDTVEVLLARLNPRAGIGPAITSLRETRHFYPENHRPQIPGAWRGSGYDSIAL